MDPNLLKAKSRNAHLLTVRDTLIEEIFAERLKAKAEQLEELILRNAELLASPSLSFMYKGTMYYSWQCSPERGANRTIHSCMLKDVAAVIDSDEFEVFEDENTVKNYISDILGITRNTRDLHALIPSRVAGPLRFADASLINIGSPLTPAEIKDFKEAHSRDYRAFKRLFFEKLLMS